MISGVLFIVTECVYGRLETCAGSWAVVDGFGLVMMALVRWEVWRMEYGPCWMLSRRAYRGSKNPMVDSSREASCGARGGMRLDEGRVG